MLENKLGITDATELARTQESISKQKALEMFESGFLEKLEPGTYKSLAMIHKYLLMKFMILPVSCESQSFKRKFSLCTTDVFGSGASKY